MNKILTYLNQPSFAGIALVFMISAPPAAAQNLSNSTETAGIDYFQPVVFRALPDGEELLQKVRARLPAVPLMLRADIKTLAKGAPDHLMKSEVELHWDAPEPNARYTIMDGFGTQLEQLEVTWTSRGPARYQHITGEDANPAASFNLYAPIQSAPITWFDISLPFLWWPGGETAGVDRRKGRDCYLVDLVAPEWEESPYPRIRVWVDEKEYLILHAEAYGPEDKLVKVIKIQSIKKINEVWMIKDLEVVQVPTQTRTKIIVQDLDLLSRARTAEPLPRKESLPLVLPAP